jgi:hypothetical protein
MKALLLATLTACGAASAPATSKPAGPWPVPTGWKSETIPFPLEFAPSITHTGKEELRFAPGMFDPAAPGYWSYAFTWRTDDVATLDADALGTELTTYFRGLLVAVDEKQHRITNPDEIVVHAKQDGAGFNLEAHIIDAFKSGKPVELVGRAARQQCSTGALWTFVIAPATSQLRSQLDDLAKQAGC